MRIQLSQTATDDPEFIRGAEQVLNSLIEQHPPKELYVIHIKNWFDHKWMYFAGKVLGKVGVLSPKDCIELPPFVPNRVLSQQRYAGQPLSESESSPVHKKMGGGEMRRRRLAETLPEACLFWYSSESIANQRGSTMDYWLHGQNWTPHFLEWRKEDIWRVKTSKGLALGEAQAMVTPAGE